MKITYIDLFCGGGGLGEGFKQAGYESAFHIDSDYWAMETVKLRECYHYLKDEKKLNLYYNYLQNSPGPYTSEKLSNKNTSLMEILTEKTYQGNSKSLLMGPSAAVLAYLVAGFFETSLYDSEVSMLLYFLVGLSLSKATKAPKVVT